MRNNSEQDRKSSGLTAGSEPKGNGSALTSGRVLLRLVPVLLLALCLCTCMIGCGNKDKPAGVSGTDTESEAAMNDAEDAADTAEEEEDAEPEELPEVVKIIEGLDEDLGPHEPMQIESIILYEDGSVGIVPLDDLKKNELGDSGETAVYPFADSGPVEDIYVVDFGNGGYRTIIALMKDGTISAVNGRALIEDHIFAVGDTVGNRDDFTEVKTVTDESATTIVGVTEEGDEITLDNCINFQ